MKVEVYGRELEITRHSGTWVAYDSGSEGKRRLARDIVIPKSLPESEVLGYLADLLHEYATIRNPDVRILN